MYFWTKTHLLSQDETGTMLIHSFAVKRTAIAYSSAPLVSIRWRLIVLFVGLNCRNFGFSGSRIRFSAIFDKILPKKGPSYIDHGLMYYVSNYTPSRKPLPPQGSLVDICQGQSDDEASSVVHVVEGVEIQELLALPWHCGVELLLQEALDQMARCTRRG